MEPHVSAPKLSSQFSKHCRADVVILTTSQSSDHFGKFYFTQSALCNIFRLGLDLLLKTILFLIESV